MKALTLTQPYASLIAFGAKRIETRAWATSYRGPLAIHAAAGLGPIGGVSGLKRLVQAEPFRSVFLARDRGYGTDIVHDPSYYLPRGAVIARCTLMTCVRTTQCTAIPDQERAFGEYSPGRYAWILSDVQPLDVPIPAKGQLGLWEWEVPS